MTGIPFEWRGERRKGLRHPYRPSIDRIDCAKGYVRGNVRLVCVIVNYAMNEWGEDVLWNVARRMTEFRKNKSERKRVLQRFATGNDSKG